MTTHKFSPEIEDAILAEVTEGNAESTCGRPGSLCFHFDDCSRCPYELVLGKHCTESGVLIAHELIKACGLELPGKLVATDIEQPPWKEWISARLHSLSQEADRVGNRLEKDLSVGEALVGIEQLRLALDRLISEVNEEVKP